jgi:restriction system protein
MTDTSRRRTGELLRRLFEVLSGNADGMAARDAIQAVIDSVELTPYELGQYESGSQRIDTIIRFATVDCVKAGWMIKQKGRWSLTDEGKAAYKKFTDPEAFYKRAVKLYHDWKDAQLPGGPQTEDSAPEDDGPIKEVSITFEKAEEQAWAEIEQYMRGMNPYDFQELVASLLRAMGYHVPWVAPPGKDGGIDILAYTDALGTRAPRIKVQVKRMKENVNVDGLRSFMALLGDDDVGLFVTTGGFTKDAEDEARVQGKRKITLVNLERLFDLWTTHYPKLEDTARRRLPLLPIYFLAPQT